MAKADCKIGGVRYSSSFKFHTKELAKSRVENLRSRGKKCARVGRTVYER